LNNAALKLLQVATWTEAEDFAAFCIRQNIWNFDGVESHLSFKRKGA
jgi:hypothetical protein